MTLRHRIALGIALALAGTACGSSTDGESLADALRQAGNPTASAGARGATMTEAVTDQAAGVADPLSVVPAGSAVNAGDNSPAAIDRPAAPSRPAGTPTVSETKAPAPPSAADEPGKGSTSAAEPGAKPAVADPAPAPVPGGPPSPAPKGTAACNDTGFIIGSVGVQSGVLGELYRPAIKAIQAYVASANAQGGINCHKIKYLVADDGNDPARQQALVRQFVEQEGVQALVYNDAPISGEASKDYLIEKRVPVIGQEGGQLYFYDSPVHFPVFASGVALMRLTVTAGAQVTVPEGKTKLAIITCQEVQICNIADKEFDDYGVKGGYEVVYKAKGSLTQPNFTSQCLEARNAGAEVIAGTFDGNSFHRMAGDCAKINYRPTLVVTSAQSADDFKDDPNLDGTVIGMNGLPWMLDDHPAIKEYQQTIRQYAPGQKFGAGGINGWTAVKAFEAAARTIPPEIAPSSAGLLAGMYTFKGNDLGGMTYPLTFTEGKRHPEVVCGWAVLVEKGRFVANDPDMFCVPGTQQ